MLADAPLKIYDYVIITTSSLAAAVTSSDFIAWKTSLGYSVRTVLIADPEIAGQPGGDLAEQIRSFLRAYYTVWGIEYVLMVGNSETVPMRYCYPDPSNHLNTAGTPGGVCLCLAGHHRSRFRHVVANRPARGRKLGRAWLDQQHRPQGMGLR